MTGIIGFEAHTDSPTLREPAGKHSAHRLAKSLFQTLPIVVVGTMALSLNLVSPVQAQHVKRPTKPKPSASELGKSIRDAFAAATRAAANATPVVSTQGTTTQGTTTQGTLALAAVTAVTIPATYVVVSGDTISGIASRYGLATASVLTLNGLGWKSVIFPGQKLALAKGGSAAIASPAVAAVPATTRYTIVSGDTLTHIAQRFGLTTQTLFSANGLSASSIIHPGQTIAVPQGTEAASLSTTRITAPATAATAAVATAAAAAPAVNTTSYVVKSGDTIAAIATKFGVSTQVVLSANNLGWSSIIYPGKALIIPVPASVSVASVSSPSTLTPSNITLTAEMRANATTIIRVGKSLGVPTYGLVIALAAAAQESTLVNLDYGDRDSIGLFQQRPSCGWGTNAQLLDPSYAAKLFFGGPTSPNLGKTKGLLEITGWQKLTVTQAAQAVQLSAFPNAYAKWEAPARTWLAQLS